MNFSFDKMEYQKLRFTISPLRDVQLPVYLGSTLRGALGWGLKKAACTMPGVNCSDCLLKGQCVYVQLFETPVVEEISFLKNQQQAPHPVLLEPPDEQPEPWKKGGSLYFNLVLTGPAIKSVPYLIQAVQNMCTKGIGKTKIPFQLVHVHTLDPVQPENKNNIWNPQQGFKPELLPAKSVNEYVMKDSKSDVLDIQFLTPMRLVKSGKTEYPATPRTMSRSLLVRLSCMLLYYGEELSKDTISETLEGAKRLTVKMQGQQQASVHRYSNRQKRQIHLHGVTGRTVWQGEAVEALRPLFKFGELFHAGKSTMMGLGRYLLK